MIPEASNPVVRRAGRRGGPTLEVARPLHIPGGTGYRKTRGAETDTLHARDTAKRSDEGREMGTRHPGIVLAVHGPVASTLAIALGPVPALVLVLGPALEV